MSPDLEREGGKLRRGGRGEKLFYRLPAPPHMLLLYKGCLESRCAAQIQMLHATTHAHTEQLQKREVPLERRKPIINILIHKQRLPSEIDFNSRGAGVTRGG